MDVFTILFYSIVVGLGAATVAMWRRASKLSRKLDELGSLTDSLRAHVSASHAELKKDLVALVRKEVASAGGAIQFNPNMTIGEVMALHPEAEKVLATFHLGGCSSCSITDYHLLGDAIRDYGVEGDALLVALNELFDSRSPSESS